jgi:cytochrome c biogenesis protein CcdA
MAASVNPCGFALLPAYLARFVAGEESSGQYTLRRAVVVSAALTAGFVVTFGVFGAVISPLAITVERYLPWATIVIGVGLVGVGVALVAGCHLGVGLPRLARGGGDGRIRSVFWFGVTYAVASLSCTIGPFLAVTSSTFTSRNAAAGIATFVVYGLGMGLVVAALTVAVALAHAGLARRLRAALPYVSRASGVLLIAAGAYVAWYGWFEVRTLAGGDGQDPIVDRATALQGWLQDVIVADRPVVVAAALAAVLAMAIAIPWNRHRRPRPASDPRAGTDAEDSRVRSGLGQT